MPWSLYSSTTVRKTKSVDQGTRGRSAGGGEPLYSLPVGLTQLLARKALRLTWEFEKKKTPGLSLNIQIFCDIVLRQWTPKIAWSAISLERSVFFLSIPNGKGYPIVRCCNETAVNKKIREIIFFLSRVMHLFSRRNIYIVLGFKIMRDISIFFKFHVEKILNNNNVDL